MNDAVLCRAHVMAALREMTGALTRFEARLERHEKHVTECMEDLQNRQEDLRALFEDALSISSAPPAIVLTSDPEPAAPLIDSLPARLLL